MAGNGNRIIELVRARALRSIAGAAIALSFGCNASAAANAVSAAAAVPLAELRSTFKAPPKSYRPMVYWWWPGGDVRDEELRREIRLLDEAHFGGAHVQPFWLGLDVRMPREVRRRVNDYPTPGFYSHLRAALEESRERGMFLDLTFGSGWPFGGGLAITPELAAAELRFIHQSVRGPSRLLTRLEFPQPVPGIGAINRSAAGDTQPLPPGWPERLRQRERPVAVIAARGQAAQEIQRSLPLPDIFDGPVTTTARLDPDSIVLLTDKVAADGTLDWDVPAGEWQIFSFSQLPADLWALGVGEGPQLVLDHLERAAFDAHARRVGDSAREHIGEFFGKQLRAIYCDSLELRVYLPWTDDFLAEFRRRRGYDLTPFLPVLKVPGAPELHAPLYEFENTGDADYIGPRIRHDYRRTVSELMLENFFTPFTQWAARNGLLSRLQAHGAQADVLRAYAMADIPETETLETEGRADELKLASSAAHVYGRKIVAAESFDWPGDPFMITPERIKRHADELLTAGVNQILYHGYAYDYADRPAPGWYPFSDLQRVTTAMNQHNSFWPYLPALNAYMTRLQYVSQVGSNVAPVALYRNELYANLGAKQQPAAREMQALLTRGGYNFDYINAAALFDSSVSGSSLISPGGARYSVLLLQDVRDVPLELMERIAALVEQGLPVIFVGGTPQEEAGYLDYRNKSERIRALMAEIGSHNTRAHHASTPQEALAQLQRSIRPNLRFVSQANVPFIHKRLGAADAYFLRNPAAEAQQIEIEFAAAASPEVWDPWSGEITPLRYFERGAQNTRVRLTLLPNESRLIVFAPGVNHSPLAATPPLQKQIEKPMAIGQDGWSFHGVGLGNGREPDIRELQLAQLVDWSQDARLRSFSGRGTYTTHFHLHPHWSNAMRGARDARLILDLGDVQSVAEIKVNGSAGPTLLLPPYRADITALVKPGRNTVEITVVSTLVNTLLARGPSWRPGKPDLNAAGKALEAVLASTEPPQRFIASGLIGPVAISLQEP